MATFSLDYLDHVITFAVYPDGIEILANELLIDGFQFDGTLSDAAAHQAIAENEKDWVEVRFNPPYNPSASALEVLRNHTVYSPEKVAAAKKIMARFQDGYVNSRHRGTNF